MKIGTFDWGLKANVLIACFLIQGKKKEALEFVQHNNLRNFYERATQSIKKNNLTFTKEQKEKARNREVELRKKLN